MCGIVARFFSGFPSPSDREALARACETLKHRGPDAQTLSFEKDAWMATARLAIRDIKHGSQPIQRDGCTIIFNGEIYNVEKLKVHLKSWGYSIKTECDTELVLGCYLKYGESCSDWLEGMYAFAIWDSREKKVVISRDRWGQKPLYYSIFNQTISIASEARTLQIWPDIPFDVDPNKILEFVKNSYITKERSLWKNIQKLKPGFTLIYQNGARTLRALKPLKLSVHLSQLQIPKSQRLFSYIQKSVKGCLNSDRPVGAFLSGGVDSSTICYFLKQYQPKAPIFSIDWDDPHYSEKVYIQTVVKHLNLNHHFVHCSQEYFTKHFDKIVQIFDEPFADESMIPTYCLSEHAKNWVDVALSGDGADEFFLGYPRYFFSGNPKTYFEVFSATSQEAFSWICPDQEITFQPNLKDQFQSLMARTWYDQQHYLPDDILVKTDRCSMAHALEVRAPFLDSNICSLALSCSVHELQASENDGKKILKEAMNGHLPQKILQRPKLGFGMPIAKWFKSQLNNWVKERLLEGELKHLNIFSIKGIESLIEQHGKNNNYSRTLFNLLVLESWLAQSSERTSTFPTAYKL